MLRPRNILFPVDFSKANEAIVDHVVGLASSFDAKIWLLSVVASLAEYHGLSEAYFGPFSDKALIKFEAERKALICDHFRRLGIMQKEHFGSVETEICVKSGGVAESIVESAHEMDMPLVMMPTRATGPGRRFLIGSVTAKVLHDASCPVWTSPHPLELEPFRRYRHIALATDYRDPTELLIQAAEIAEFFHARLSVFSALPARSLTGDHNTQDRKQAIAEELKNQISARRIEASVHLMEGSPGEITRQFAEIEEPDVIVTGRGHLKETMGHLWTHAYEIICNAPCPVITLTA